MRVVAMVALVIFLVTAPLAGAYLLVDPAGIEEEPKEPNENEEPEENKEENDDKKGEEKDYHEELARLIEELRQNIPEDRRYPAIESREYRDVFFDDDGNPLTQPIPSPRHK